MLEVDATGFIDPDRVKWVAEQVYGEPVSLDAVRVHPNREAFIATKQRRGFMLVLREGEEAGVDAFIEADYQPKDRDPKKVSGPHPSRLGERQFGDAALQQHNR